MHSPTCLACGGPVAATLVRGGSLRCHDCRDGAAPLDPARCLPPPQLAPTAVAPAPAPPPAGR